jgi:hypothetical protein
MFLPAQLICCSKLGAKLSFYYGMWGEGPATTVKEVALGVFFFSCALWNMIKACLVHLDTIYDIYGIESTIFIFYFREKLFLLFAKMMLDK